MSEKAEKKERKKREKLEKKLAQAEGKRQQKELNRSSSLKRLSPSRNLSSSSRDLSPSSSSQGVSSSPLKASKNPNAAAGGARANRDVESSSGGGAGKFKRISSSSDVRRSSLKSSVGVGAEDGQKGSPSSIINKYLPGLSSTGSPSLSSSPSSSPLSVSSRVPAPAPVPAAAPLTDSLASLGSEDDDPNLPELAGSEETQDAILNLIESESMGPVFRSVFEQGREQEFDRALAVFIRAKKREIESICNFHYQEFIHSVDELLALRVNAAQVKEQTIQLNGQIQATGASLLGKAQTLLELRKTYSNISSAIEELSRCVFVFSQCEQANRQITEGQLYKALKVLREIEHQSLPQLPQYEFVKYLERKIPALKETIKKYVTDEFNDWLVSIRERALDIGALAMEQVAAQIKEEKRIKQELHNTVFDIHETEHHEKKQEEGKKTKRRNKQETQGHTLQSREVKEMEDQEVGIFQQVGVTFVPVYKCMHIYDSLSSAAEFESYYQHTRQLQAHLVLQGPSGPAFLASTGTYESYFYQITGFFYC